MSKYNRNDEQKNAKLNISNDDFESPVVFKKFKSSNNNIPTKRIKHKKSSGKKQLTLHQVYDENFKHSDMNAEHLQLALALSRSTSEMINNHSIKEEFPLTSQKDGKKATLLEFGFKTNKPKMNVDNKILRRAPSRTNKKSKFRFVTPILMMRTEEERESLIQSKLSTICEYNSGHSFHYENSIPVVISEELNKIRCQECSLFYLDRKDDTSEEKEYLVSQLNIEKIRARSGVLLKDWKQIALRDHTPSRSREDISHIEETNNLHSKIKNCSLTSSLIAEKNSEMRQFSNNDSINDNNIVHLKLETLQTETNFESSECPSKYEDSVGFEYAAISPDLFDNDVSSLSNSATQIKKNLNSIFSGEDISYEKNTANSSISSNDKFMFSENCESNLKMELSQGKNINLLMNFDSEENECEERNYDDSLDECIIIKTKQDYNMAPNEMNRKLKNIDKVLQDPKLNIDENRENNLSNSENEELKISPQSDRSLLVSNENINVISSDEEFPILEIKASKDGKCPSRAGSALHHSCNKSDGTQPQSKIPFQTIEENNFDKNIDFCEKSDNLHSNEELLNASSENCPLANESSFPQSIHYDYSVGSKLSESMSSGSYKEVKVLSLRTDNVNITKGRNFEEIILSSDEENCNEKSFSDILELGKLHKKYCKNSHYCSVSNSSQNHDNKSNFLKEQMLLDRKVSDYFNYSDEKTIDNNEHSPTTSNNSKNDYEREKEISLSPSNNICSAESSQGGSEPSFENLEVAKPSRKFSDNSNISAVDHCSEISFSLRSNLSQNHKCEEIPSQSSDKTELKNKNLSYDYELDFYANNSDSKCVDIANTKDPAKCKKSQEYFSDTLNFSMLDDVFEKQSTWDKDNCKSEGPNIPPTESTESYNSFGSDDDEIKYFWNNECLNNLNGSDEQGLADASNSSSSSKCCIPDLELDKIEGNKSVEHFSFQPVERDHFDMNVVNVENTSKACLKNTPNQKLRNTFNTPLKRYTSFDENGQTPKTKLILTRHKSESNITPSRKFIIKSEKITPMIDYNTLSTPDIVQELDKFGLKPLKRKRGINLLKHIYETTHPVLESHQRGLDEISVVKRRKSVVEDNDNLGDLNSSMNKNGLDVKKVWSGTILESDAIFERQRPSKKVSTCQIPLQIVWHNFVNENPEILQNILLYEPLQVEVIHTMLKELGYKFHIQDLITFLDQKCITIRVAQGHQDKGG